MHRFWELWNAAYFNTPNDGGGGNPPPPGNGGGNPPPGGGNPPPGDQPWYSTALAPEHHEWARSKQFADPNAAIASYRSLEQVMGRQRLAVPKDDADEAAFNAIYQTLGRPGEAKGYKLADGVKFDDKVWDRFSGVFHKAGLSQKQAEAITKEFHAFGTEGLAAKETARATAAETEKAALQKEWGDKYDGNSDLAKRAFRAAGLSEDMSDKIEDAIGYGAFMRLFAKLGEGMGEQRLSNDGGGGNFSGNSVEQAQAAIDTRMKDPAFMKRYQSSNAAERNAAINEIQPFFKIVGDAKDAARGANR